MTKTFSISSVAIVIAVAASALFLSASMVHAAGPWYVSAATGSDTNNCTSAAGIPPIGPCKTIQAAITLASPGDTINVAAGIYAEHVSINKADLILNGANSGLACKAARSTESVIIGAASGAVSITADNVTLNGFQISSVSNALGAGIWTSAGGTVAGFDIKNNLISQNQIGLFPNTNGASSVSCNIFDGNNEPGSAAGAGIYSEVTNNLTVDNNEFKNHLNNNPVIFASAVADTHVNLTFSNNSVHENYWGGIILMAVDGGAVTGNDISATDATGVSFQGGSSDVTVTGNLLHDSARGVRFQDTGFGPNTNIDVNRNAFTTLLSSISLDDIFGIGNILGGHTGDVNGECNWWDAADGPSTVGTGSGSPVTTGVDFTPWLTTSDLVSDPCTGGAPPPDVTVTLAKYVDGVHADATSADGLSFPMDATWNATNIGAGSGSFALSTTGFNNPNPYEATTAEMTNGADYSASENLTGPNVGASCSDSKPFALVGYKVGDTEALAALAATSSGAALTGITSDKFIIVLNETCSPAPTTVQVTIAKYVDGVRATATSANSLSFPMTATWDSTSHSSGSGPFTLDIPSYEAQTVNFNSGADYSASENLTGPNVGASCSDSKPFALVGYSTGTSEVDAAGNPVSATIPAFTGITTDQYIIVWNEPCEAPPPVVPPPPANACATPTVAPAGYTLQNGTTGNDTVTIAPFTMFVGKGGVDIVNGPAAGNYIVCTGSANDTITLGNGDFTVDAGNGNNSITVGNGDGSITTGAANDSITTGNGVQTISAGNGNNTILTGDGDKTVTTGSAIDKITTGAGNDVINAGGGNNTVKSGAGDDSITTGSANDNVDGGADTDTCSVGGGINTVVNCES